MDSTNTSRRALLGAGQVALAGGAVAAAAAAVEPARAYAQAAGDSLLRTVLDRGHLLVGTGSTNAPWHFEDEKGELVGMDIAMARILAKGLFDDESKVGSSARTRPPASRTSPPARSTSSSSS